VDTFHFFGKTVDGPFLHLILPLGISFYTFQTLSYTIDIYRKKIEPTSDFIAFAAFVSFFPQLVAGPIERAQNLLPQFLNPRKFDFDNAIRGINQIVWGLFKKLVIADTCAQYVNDIFTHYDSYSSLTLILGAVYFSFQIYADFSGYSDIAIGTARLFGFKLMINFKYPYFATNVAEFWRKWHISLSTWFRDYVYIPFGGSRVSKVKLARNILLVFIISGFWHGANWTFILWGLINGILILPFALSKTSTEPHPRPKPIIGYLIFQRVLTFSIITIGWIFFRSESVTLAIDYISQLATFQIAIDRLAINRFAFEILPLIILFIAAEWYSRKKEFPLIGGKYNTLKVLVTILLILLFGNFAEMQEFIYFQF
jgi:D-alanyl-lipoteichoic acid acyltransferase DltB (MBOAT superfamily)